MFQPGRVDLAQVFLLIGLFVLLFQNFQACVEANLSVFEPFHERHIAVFLPPMLAIFILQLRHCHKLVLEELSFDAGHHIEHLGSNNELIAGTESEVLVHDEVCQQTSGFILNFLDNLIVVELL